jgi:four helix bundle protein
MVTFKRFEDLPVWQEAIRLAEGVYNMTESKAWRSSPSLRDQIERAALSVSNNIAEGFERGTTKELLAFLYIARGSAGEVRSMLCFLNRRAASDNLKSEISNLKSIAESCSRQIRAWAEHLQNSEIQGQRHLNDKTSKSFQRKKDQADFLRELQQYLPEELRNNKT